LYIFMLGFFNGISMAIWVGTQYRVLIKKPVASGSFGCLFSFLRFRGAFWRLASWSFRKWEWSRHTWVWDSTGRFSTICRFSHENGMMIPHDVHLRFKKNKLYERLPTI
jgi:hypothetical protein